MNKKENLKRLNYIGTSKIGMQETLSKQKLQIVILYEFCY